MKLIVGLVETPLDADEVARAVGGPAAGAVVLFVGTVRAETAGREVVALEYEAHRALAEAEFRRYAADARSRWPLEGVAIVHRVGRLAVGEASVVIATAAAHREAAYEANRFLLERLKASAPIWKREVYLAGSAWVGMGGG